MASYKLTYTELGVVVLACLIPIVPARSAEPDGPPAPAFSETNRVFLSRVARRTVRDSVLGRKKYSPDYVPAALSEHEAEVVVRLREGGYLLATAASGVAPVAEAVREATLTAVELLLGESEVGLDLVNRMLIEIEVVGKAQTIPTVEDWTQPRAVDPFIEPGVHGLVLAGSRARHRFCPTEIYTSDLIVADALKRFAQSTHASPDELKEVTLKRFRTAHWYESKASGKIVSLHRGLSLIEPGALTPQRLDQAIERLGDYMIYRQLESGLFTYQYEPALDRYSDEQNLVRQVGAVLAIAVYAKHSGRSAARSAADIGIRYHLRGLTGVPGVENAAFIASADGENKLGVTALLCLAMAEHPQAGQYAAVREKLINGMRQLERPSGMFLTAFPPAVGIAAQDYFPGEALLAMAAHYRLQPSAAILDSFHRAIGFYREFFRDNPSPAFVPWQVQAYTLMAKHSKRDDYVDYVFELTDWLVEKQLSKDNCPWPELWGGIAAYQPGRVGVATAAYLEGFADALALARTSGDSAREARYQVAVNQAARFVLQLQIRPEEAYFIRSPRDAIGAIRTSPSLNLLRIDHCQHALIGLIKARGVLFP